MANELSRIEIEALDYVQKLTGKDSIMLTTKQTSVRIEVNNLATIDALAEMGKRSRNQVINDALDFGLRLIRDQFDAEDIQELNKLFAKHCMKLSDEGKSNIKS